MTTINVNAGGNLQQAIDAAQPGDIVSIEAGATFTGPFSLPDKGSATPITLQSSRLAELPAGRVLPSNSNLLPKLVSPGFNQPVIHTKAGAHHWNLVGIECLPVSESVVVSDLVKFGDGSNLQNTLAQIPHHLMVDRCYVHGWPNQNVKRGIALNSGETSITNSWISDIHGEGYDTQAICGWNGTGPYKIINNQLEAAGENIMFGGADPFVPNIVPSDIEIRRNTIFKPLSWKIGHASYAGKHWTVKNLLELKLGRRVTIDGNVLENCWVDGQVGFAVLLKSVNQDGACTWCVTEDVVFTNNTIKSAEHGVNLLDMDWNPAVPMKRVKITNNLIETRGMFCQLSGVDGVTLEHNTHIQIAPVSESRNTMTLYGRLSPNLIIRNNILRRSGYGIKGDSMAEGSATLNAFAPASLFAGNVVLNADQGVYPAENFYPTTLDGFTGKGTDGKDPGVDMAALQAAQAGTVAQPPPPPPPVPEYRDVSFAKDTESVRTALYQKQFNEGYAAWNELPGNKIKFRKF